MGKARSLLLVTVDCLRADHVGFMGYQRPTTPFLDSLAGDSVIFHNAIVSGSPTYYSFPSIMASRHPLALGRDVIGLGPGEPTLATSLSQSGYATAAFIAGNIYLSRRFGYDAGFDTFNDFLDLENAGTGPSLTRAELRSRFNQRLAKISGRSGILQSIYRELYFRYCQWMADSSTPSFDLLRRVPAADLLVDEACDWLAGLTGEPFFLWLHFMDPHAPYYPREEAFRLLGEAPIGASRAAYLNSYWRREGLNNKRFQRHREGVVTLYDAAVRWVDAQIARLVQKLRQTNLWEDCVFAFTADHGEEFLDHGGRFHSPSKVTEELIRVPCFLRAPEIRKMESRTPFGFLDLAPTLLEAVGSVPPHSFRGHSRWQQLRAGHPWYSAPLTECLAEFTDLFHRGSRLGPRVLAVREGNYKLVFDFSSRRQDLFDLQTDPDELRSLAVGSQPSVRRRLLERLRDHIADSLRTRDPALRLGAILRELRLESGTLPSEASQGDPLVEVLTAASAGRSHASTV